ncbi:hypothetical protein PSN45_002959 [Yamadazyma tenuis]|uniref:Hyphally-regulated cell wall protein N-terminal domain-containing protein n=1 Tax=Candida tenuis (strain ATCC 10573 / BCRC 21748 / CBS 615 / JCM 9827 / NBRC 10315 / NRRL Y-1498 / VKM Y-70) TaxID=590646 RepID=G3AW36_CANTC|nr:uncharacterized protein CANTEDRAFT_112175 [Yamadazyma tenuis ATCC 10573]EGV66440.1 hypothetical protein CANTEDRAFT_112175 [Yamadazyma tenuis ATCC 10573]WEJ95440.1 hypothetical protein PSN45_002959 [Yamadazyma tenuis]
MKLTSLFNTLFLVASALASDIHITKNTDTVGNSEVNYGDVTVDSGITWNLVDAEYVHFHGDFDNEGDVYVTSDSASCAVNFKISGVNTKTTNSGQIVVSSGDSFTSPVFRIGGNTFENTGKIFFGGYGKTGLPIGEITSSSFHNNGLIALYQDKRNSGLVKLGAFLGSLTNDGTVCLKNQAFSQQGRILGTGCFDIGENGNVWIKSAALSITETQNFYFSSTGGSIRVEAVSAPQTFHVSNWGGDNVIGLSLPISEFGYSEDGILTVKCGLLPFYFDIGTGYDFNKMKQVTADFGTGIGTVINGGIVYQDDAPSSSRPSICATCEDLPSAPSL